MSEQPRDWDRELADIDRQMAKQGGSPPGGPASLPSPRAPVPAGGAAVRRHSVALVWFWVLLAVALGFALPLWPYQRSCGLQLIFFLGAAGVTVVIAVLGALASWSARRGLAHILSLLVLVWAAVVALREVLPRVGYAKTSLTWMCESGKAPGPAVPGAARPGADGAPGGAREAPAPGTTAPAQTGP